MAPSPPFPTGRFQGLCPSPEIEGTAMFARALGAAPIDLKETYG
jgi:hypothetical protein